MTHGTVALEVAVVGDVMVDVLVEVRDARVHGSDTPSRIATAPGGGGANQAVWLARGGVRVGLAAAVGEDPLGGAARRALADAGVDVSSVATVDGATGTVVALVEPDGERTMLTDRGANLALRAETVEPLLRRVAAGGHVHVSGYALLDDATRSAGVAALELAAGLGLTRSVDASSVGPLRAMGAERFLSLTSGAERFFCNLAEGRVLTACEDAPSVAAALAASYGEVVVTLGEGGALAVSPDGELHRAAVGSVPVVDTVGAGDALTATYLARRLRGAAAPEALAAASAAAAAVVEGRGARGWAAYSRT